MDNHDDAGKQWTDLLGKIRGVKFAMLATRDEGGRLHSRPMATLEASDEGVLWFFTGRSSHKAHEIGESPRVNLSYVDGGKDTFLSVSGEASLVDDAEKARALWSPAMKAWFPGGLEDPELILLRVDVEEAEYWDVASKKMTTLVRFVKSLAGHPPSGDMRGHGVIRPS